jgi:hypothetical protein
MRRQTGDDAVEFWVAIHKLFSGSECIHGLNFTVQLQCFHYNDKIRRVQLLLNENPPAVFPFRFTDGIAEFRSAPEVPPGLLFPVPHPRLVEPAKKDVQFVRYRVPKANSNLAAFEPGAEDDQTTGAEIRPAPPRGKAHHQSPVASRRGPG